MAKASGDEIREFYDTGWPAGFDWSATATQIYSLVWEGDDIVTRFLLDPARMYDLRDFGYFQPSDGSVSYFGVSFEEAFMAWKKRQRNQAANTVCDESRNPASSETSADQALMGLRLALPA